MTTKPPAKKKPADRGGPAVEPWARPPRWSTIVLLVAAVTGVVLAAVSTWVHHNVQSGGYTSFCNLNETVNCDTVVTSPYGTLFRLPVSVWAMGYYAILAWLTIRTMRADRHESERARGDAFGWAVAGTLFSAYLATISIAVLKTICLLCAGLYAVSLLALLAAWTQAAPLDKAMARLRERWDTARSHPGLSTAAVATVVGVLALSSWLGAATKLTREDVFRSNPQFFDWYMSQPIVDDPIPGGHARGPENAPIQLVEFSDFECPHCAQAYVTLKDLLPRYKEQIRFVAHHYPLSSDCTPGLKQKGHEHACKSAAAAVCAAKQDKYELYSNLLFANQGKLDEKSLRDYAKQVGLDLDGFDKCVASQEPADEIAADVKAGDAAGVKSTPTFFINGRRIEGNMPYENWLMAFAVELDKP